jgi:hypothetical protein
MSKTGLCLVVAVVSFAVSAVGGLLQNSSFEIDLGMREALNVWGDHSDSFGDAFQVVAGKGNDLRSARTGTRVMVLNAQPASWNGVWQQASWKENTPFRLSGSYQIRGDLGSNWGTFLKVEFYDGNDQLIKSQEGPKRHEDTGGKWVLDVLEGTAPPGTMSVRFVIVAGDNGGGKPVVNRIFWDDVDASE